MRTSPVQNTPVCEHAPHRERRRSECRAVKSQVCCNMLDLESAAKINTARDVATIESCLLAYTFST